MVEDPKLRSLEEFIRIEEDSFSIDIFEIQFMLKKVMGHVMALGSQNGAPIMETPRQY